MNGADMLTRTLLANGVDLCLANPGTSEMHFVAALDRHAEMRSVLCLFEGVATGAADGFGRMADRPAATLMHLGFGLSNGLANLHNARRASSPVVNVVGDHATWHRGTGSALETDVVALAQPMSDWVRRSESAGDVGRDAAEAVAAATSDGGRVATLILPADAAWGDCTTAMPARPAPAQPDTVPSDDIEQAAMALLGDDPCMIVLGGHALREGPLKLAGRIAARTGARLATPYGVGRIERGGARTEVERLPGLIDPAREVFRGIRHVILIGTALPAAMFAYPDKPRRMPDDDARILTLGEAADSGPAVLEALCDAVGAPDERRAGETLRHAGIPEGTLTPDRVLQVVSGAMPENSIIVDESISSGRRYFPLSRGAVPHDYLQLTGGALGTGIPLALGAALACPDRPVINLEGDGSAMYTLQGLWTQARENVDALTIVFSNRRYNILEGELRAVGVEGEIGERARQMLSLEGPGIDWTALARGFGLPAQKVQDCSALADIVRGSAGRRGPLLVEAVLA